MTEFRVQRSGDDWIEVLETGTLFDWTFSVVASDQGRRTLSAPTTAGWGGGMPDDDMTEAACAFAQAEALKAGHIDG